MFILGIPIGTYRLDRSWRGEIDPLAAETPANWADPFKETRAEARLKSEFHEPIENATSATSTQARSTKNAGATGGDSEISPAAMAKANKIYQERCASCHGDKGNGDGPGAFAIKPKPRDYTDSEWQKTVTDEELAKAIVKGGAAVGKSYMMPANYDLKSKPEVAAGLVQIVRSFAEK
jgi:mono/diheme cytochrome c family protein